MLTLWLMLQLQDDINNFILQLAGAPPHWLVNVRDYLDEHLSSAMDWISHGLQYATHPMATPKFFIISSSRVRKGQVILLNPSS
ncbi:hypothetical protein TNCV_1914541 [Trichonephila clavipes]|nr:hypothetical protein TNCV_1914541 [Trichonephila clavipes]